MPSVRVVPSPGGLAQVIFMNDAGVGRNQPNRRGDVLLVQFFLSRLWDKPITDNPGEKYGVPGAPVLQVDGICGDRTIAAIRQFQSWYQHDVVSDGVVSVLPKGQAMGAIHKKVFLIIGLNLNYAVVFGKDQHRLLLNESGFPASLRDDLFAG